MWQTASAGLTPASADVARALLAKRSPAMWQCSHLHQALHTNKLLTIGKASALQSLKLCRPQHSTTTASLGNCGNVSDLAGEGSSLPQPQACNAGEVTSRKASRTTSNLEQSHQSNGTSAQSSTSTISELQQLRQDLSQLSQTVTAQAKALQDQTLAVQQARQLAESTDASRSIRSADSFSSRQSGWNKDVKPFEVQRNAIGDRRYLGGYDARFHSTNM